MQAVTVIKNATDVANDRDKKFGIVLLNYKLHDVNFKYFWNRGIHVTYIYVYIYVCE